MNDFVFIMVACFGCLGAHVFLYTLVDRHAVPRFSNPHCCGTWPRWRDCSLFAFRFLQVETKILHFIVTHLPLQIVK